jgi:hypothetical protein
MIGAVVFTVCNSKKESGGVKLLERIEEENGTILVTLEYDKQNRLVKISEMMRYYLPCTSTITYDKNTVTIEVEWADGTTNSPISYVRDGNIITYSIVDPHGSPSYSYFTTMTVNNDGYIITEETQWQDGFSLIVNYEYQGGKLTSITPSNDERKWYGGHLYQRFIYDDNKSPFYNDKTPKWLLQKLFLAGFSDPNDGLNNNITFLEYNYDGSVLSYTNYEYEFDSDGFPTKEISSFPYWGDNDYPTTMYSTKRYIYRGEAYKKEDSGTDGAALLSSTGYLFEQNFSENDVSLVYDDYDHAGLNSYVPNIGFSAGKRVVYNGSIKLLDRQIPETALAVLNKDELRLLRNAIYAKHGRIFQSNDLKTHFRQFDWYEPMNDNVDDRLTEIDKNNIRRIQVFENAHPNSILNKSNFASCYYGVIPLGVSSWCPEISFNEDNTIVWDGGGEDNFKGSYKIENGFLTVLVTGQNVGAEEPRTTEYFLDNNWHWPNGVTYSNGTVIYKEPVKLVFPVGDAISTYVYEIFYYQGRQIGSDVWWIPGFADKDKPIVHIRRATDELLNTLDSFYEYSDTGNSGERIVLWTETTLKDFDFIAVEYNNETDYWAASNLFYRINELLPGEGLLLNTYIGEGIPTRGISFRDENNRLRFFAIRENGVTNGEYHLTELPITAAG